MLNQGQAVEGYGRVTQKKELKPNWPPIFKNSLWLNPGRARGSSSLSSQSSLKVCPPWYSTFYVNTCYYLVVIAGETFLSLWYGPVDVVDRQTAPFLSPGPRGLWVVPVLGHPSRPPSHLWIADCYLNPHCWFVFSLGPFPCHPHPPSWAR